MTAGLPAPTRYLVDGDPRPLLAFRTQHIDGRLLLLLIPDSDDQHPLDAVACFLDEPRLRLAPSIPERDPGQPKTGAVI